MEKALYITLNIFKYLGIAIFIGVAYIFIFLFNLLKAIIAHA